MSVISGSLTIVTRGFYGGSLVATRGIYFIQSEIPVFDVEGELILGDNRIRVLARTGIELTIDPLLGVLIKDD